MTKTKVQEGLRFTVTVGGRRKEYVTDAKERTLISVISEAESYGNITSSLVEMGYRVEIFGKKSESNIKKTVKTKKAPKVKKPSDKPRSKLKKK